jgi:hypothetical protein
MNRLTAAPLLFAFLMLANPVASPQDLAHREKVAEENIRNGRTVILSKTPD